MKTRILYSITFVKTVPFMRSRGKIFVQLGRPQMTICRMRIACWTPKTTNIFSEYVILTAFPQQQWLHERISILRNIRITPLV